MKILNFVYYSLFKLSSLIKRRNGTDSSNACNILALMISTNTILIVSILLRVIFIKGFLMEYDIYIKIVFLSIFFLGIFI